MAATCLMGLFRVVGYREYEPNFGTNFAVWKLPPKKGLGSSLGSCFSGSGIGYWVLCPVSGWVCRKLRARADVSN